MTELYRCTPRQVRQFAIDVMEAGLVPFIQSSPGMGKSSIVRSIAKDANTMMIDHRLSTSQPEDMSGLPEFYDTPAGRRARFVPFGDLFPLQGDALPEGKDGWTLFLDEFNSGSREIMAAAYKLILDRMVGQHKLHDQCLVVAAGNLDTDRAITNKIGTAMQSRVVTLEMQLSYEEWLYDVALKEGYDARVLGFLGQYPSKLMDFRPDHKDKTFCCPRTWSMVNALVKGKPVTDDSAVKLAGTITSGTAADFVQFCQLYESVTPIKTILAEPLTAPVPSDIGTKWAVVSSVMEHIAADNFDILAKYIDRFSADFRILFYRNALVRKPELRSTKAFVQAMISLGNYLHG